MKRCNRVALLVGLVVFFLVRLTGLSWSQAGGHASVGLGHGEEGFLHLEEMVKHLEFSLNMPDASPELKRHGGAALQHAREALRHYHEALTHASESLGRPARNRMGGDSGYGSEEGSNHSHEGSGDGGMYGRAPRAAPKMEEGSR